MCRSRAKKKMFWTKGVSDGPIGLIAGEGEFPLVFAQAASSLKKELIVIGVEGLTDKRVETYAAQTHYVQLGELGKVVDLLKKIKLKQAVFAGGIPKNQMVNPSFKLDDTAKGFLSASRDKGDDHLLRALELFLKVKCGVSIVDSRSYLKDAMASKGVMTKRAPTEEEWDDLRFGYKIAKSIGSADIGQTVVVKRGVVLAVEAVEGTDQAIRRGGSLGYGSAVVVKVAKPKQDLRFDLPCVGPQTLESLKAAQSQVLGVEAGKTIFLFKERLIASADEQNMTLVGL